MEDTGLTASIGVRLSKQARDTNLSLVGMLDDCRDVAKVLGARVIAEHVDDGTSGAVRDRPKHLAWLQDAVSGRADILIAPYTDRLTREGVNAAAMVLDVVEGKDPITGRVVRPPVRLVTVDGLDSERDAEAFRWRFVIAAEVARAERARIASRNKATRVRLAEAQRWAGGPVPFGRRPVDAEGGGKVLVEHEEEAALLREVAQRIIAGEAMRALTRWMSARSRTRSGREWQRSSLRATMLSKSTEGLLPDRATVRALRAALKPSARPKAKGGRPVRRLLTGGIAWCGSCQRKLTTSAGRYVCLALSSGEVCPAPVTINARILEAYVEEMWLDSVGDDEQTRTVPVGGVLDAELDQILDDVTEVARKFATATAGELPALTERMTELRTREAELRARSREDDLHVVVPAGQTWADAWKDADADGRRNLLRETGFLVVVNPTQHGNKDAAARCAVDWIGR